VKDGHEKSLQTIKDLERRRDMARKEIKQLYVRLKAKEKEQDTEYVKVE